MKCTTPLLAVCLSMSMVTSAAPVPIDGYLVSVPPSRPSDTKANDEAFIPLLLRRDDADGDDANNDVLYRRLGSLFGKGASKVAAEGAKEGAKKWSTGRKWAVGLGATAAAYLGYKWMTRPPPVAMNPSMGQGGGMGMTDPTMGQGVGMGGMVMVPSMSGGAGGAAYGNQFAGNQFAGNQFSTGGQVPAGQYATMPMQANYATGAGTGTGTGGYSKRSPDDDVLRGEALVELRNKRAEDAEAALAS